MAGLKTPKLDQAATTSYRSTVMRLQYLAQDRADLGETAKCMAQRMKEPTVFDLQGVRRVARYLIGRPKARLRFREQRWPEEIVVLVDADWCGDPVTRKSTTGCLVFIGTHCCKGTSNLQSLIALSVGEAEFYAITKGSAMGLSFQSILAELGLRMRVVIRSDSSSAGAMSSRVGVGRNKHMQSKWLWVQDRIQQDHLKVKKIWDAR